MEITFTTKEKSNKRRKEEFLKLTPAERIYKFLALVVRVNKFPTKVKKENKNNFVIEIKSK
ncbi:MAG TPA: hypothetical protein EYG85_03780 [Crocinitomix sp.]|nr:hypothetical protein [Crocinitomix sp.]